MSTTISLDRAFSSNSRLGSYTNGLPPQTVTINEKETDEWKRGCMNFMVNEAKRHDGSKAKDLKKFRMLDDEFQYKDNMWAVDPLNLGDKKEELYGGTDPIQHYPIVNTPLNTILGERINRVTQFFCVSEAPESRNEYYRQKTDQLQDYVMGSIQQRIMNEIIQEAQNNGQQVDERFMQEAQQQVQQRTPEEVQAYMDEDYVDVVEKTHNRMLKNIIRKNDLESEFIEGFRYSTIIGKEFYSFEVVNNNLRVKNINPFNVFYHKSKSTRWISESQYAGYRLRLTPSSIIDTYREHLTVDDIDMLENKMNPGKSGGVNSVTGIKSIGYNTNVFSDWHGNTYDNIARNDIDAMIDGFMTNGENLYSSNGFGLFDVTQAFWKSYRKVGILEVFLEGDVPVEQLVDETYVADANAGEHITWYYLNQVYQGTDINGEILINVGPYPHQIFDENDPDYSPLPIEGCEYNNFNGKTISIMDLMLPWAELYDIVANELKKDLKKAMGKVMFMSVDHIPNIEGFDMNKWMYWAKEFGIAWVGQGKNKSSFSHFSAQDMSFAEQINSKMNLLDKIKMNCDGFGGFSQPRVAGQSSSPTQGQDQQKVTASANQTEYYFWKHSKCCEKVLTHSLNISKALARNSKKLDCLYDDMDQRYIQSDIAKATAANSAVYVLNSSQIFTKREGMRQMAMQAAGKTGQPADMGDIMMADTVNEIKKVLKTIGRKEAAAAQQAQQVQQQEMEQRAEIASNDLAFEKEKLYATLESQERRTYMQSFSRQEDNLKDTDQNGQADILENEKHFEQVTENMRKNQRELRKQDIEKLQKDKELSIKEKELGIKRDQNTIARENMNNDLQIAKQNSKNRGTKK